MVKRFRPGVDAEREGAAGCGDTRLLAQASVADSSVAKKKPPEGYSGGNDGVLAHYGWLRTFAFLDIEDGELDGAFTL